MADRVNDVMEEMAPALEDLREKGIFSDEELRSIVKKRTQFEYLVNRRTAEKLSFIKYIDYEINLDVLRKKRKSRLGIHKKSSVSDWAGLRHIHFIYERALLRFKMDVDMWFHYIRFCKRHHATQQLNKTFSRALVLHPYVVQLWITAAMTEFSVSNMSAARSLMQRALRINKTSQKLWTTYYFMEWSYVDKLTERHEILMDQGDKSDKLSLVNEGSSNELQLPEGYISLLNGALPRVVYHNAVAAIPDDLEFRQRLLLIALQPSYLHRPKDVDMSESEDGTSETPSNTPARKEHAQAIRENMIEDFPNSSLAWKLYSLGSDDPISAFQKGLDEIQNKDECSLLWQEYSEYVESTLKRSEKNKTLTGLFKIFSQAEAAGRITASMYLQWLRCFVSSPAPKTKVAQSKRAQDIQKISKMGVTAFPSCAELWMAHIQISLDFQVDESEVEELYAQATKCVSPDDSIDFWKEYVSYFGQRNENDRIIDTFGSALTQMSHGHDRDNLALFFLDWLSNLDIRAKIFQECDKIIAVRPVNRDVLLRCIDLHIDGESTQTRSLFELATTEFENDVDLWIKYFKYESSLGNFDHAHSIFNRGLRTLSEGDATLFQAQCH